MSVATSTISFSSEQGVYIGTVRCSQDEFLAIMGETYTPALCATFKPGVEKRMWDAIRDLTSIKLLPDHITTPPSHAIMLNMDKLAKYTSDEVYAIWRHEVGHIVNGDTLIRDHKAMGFQAKLLAEIAADKHAAIEVGRRVVAKVLWKTANDYFGGQQDITDRGKRFLVAKAYRGRLRALFGD